jgi:transaldolase/glucose-6-phosphate isomerase
MNPIHTLHNLGQSIWYDNIQRRLLENGELQALIENGEIRGITSNPTIFQQAIARSNDYDAALLPLAWSGWDSEPIFWQLAVEDISWACDLFLPLYQQTGGADGYVSLEVSPYLAHDTAATFEQVQALWRRVGRPNLMIKIPATREGLPAIRRAIAAGINVNVTLIFAIERYQEVMDAYLSGLEDRLAAGENIERIASVASFFVSRLDTKLDARLPADSPLRGKAAIANAKLAYAAYQQVFSGERFSRLLAHGARPQRPLWASTSTKNPAYPDTLYVDHLIGPGTVNTVPPQTLVAFRHHGRAALTLTEGLDEARRIFADLESAGYSLAQANAELEEEGVRAFADSFTALLAAIDEKRRQAAAQTGPLSASVSRRVANLERESVPARLWRGDPSLWTDDPAAQAEIRKRLGWLTLPETSRARLAEIRLVAEEVRRAGIKKFLLLGMGGSSLAPEVLSLVFSAADRFAILDSTDPAQVLETARRFPPEESLYIVASKSGGTAEVNAMLAYFWQLSGQDGSRFIAITDPGTSLEALAREQNFRHILLADPTVGGRFSVLADFGLLPMALIGLDLEQVLFSAANMRCECRRETPVARNPCLVLGAILGEAALSGRDKLTLIADSPLASFGWWLEQLIAESSGKQGRGIVVVEGEPLVSPEGYGDDRLFVYFRRSGEWDAAVERLRAAGYPVLEFPVLKDYDLFGEFYRWEVATAIACHVLGVNAFDQPDVQDNKDRTKAKIASYSQNKALEEPIPFWQENGLRLFTNLSLKGDALPDLLKAFLNLASPGNYVAVNAYLPRNQETQALLTELRLKIRARTGCATTLGFGPRFLHSTGQLHKGGADIGLFLQITADPVEDLEIPAQGMTFGVLERAQALGDYEALAARGRRILRVHLTQFEAINRLLEALE